MYFAGIDVGSLSTETVIIDRQGRMVAYEISGTGANSRAAGERSLNAAIKLAGLSNTDIEFTVATGYGRISMDFADKALTEIACHGRGAHHLFPGTRTIVDIGGQDSKVIKLSDQGKVIDFAMNDKCAAGTGRFLEVMAKALEVELDQMGTLSLEAQQEVSISSMCTVFAESEVISLVARSVRREDILKGIHSAICKRISALLDRLGPEPELTMTGGVAKNIGIVRTLGGLVGMPANVPSEPQIVGALGAALIARDQCENPS